MDRRRFLGAALGVSCAFVLPNEVAAAPRRHAIAEVERSDLGITFRLELAHAPFPCPGGAYTDPSVMVYVPRHYQAPDDALLDMVVHFHGHGTMAARAIKAHALREQLFESRQNAILVVPQGAVNAPESGVGKLAQPGGLRRLLGEVARVLDSEQARADLGEAALPREAKLGMVCLSAHSGGYTSVAASLTQGRTPVREVFLFDALYSEVPVFRDWVLEAKEENASRERHKLVSYYAGERVRLNNMALLGALRAGGVECLHEVHPAELSRGQMTRGRAIFLRTELVHASVASELNALRDCLFASCLRRRVDTDWFDSASGPRRLDPRG